MFFLVVKFVKNNPSFRQASHNVKAVKKETGTVEYTGCHDLIRVKSSALS